MSITIRNTYGTPHKVSESNPAHVVGCDKYRLTFTGAIYPHNPGYENMIRMLRDNSHDTRPEGYGLVLLESEEFSATYFGSIDQIEHYNQENVDGTTAFDFSHGVTYAQWPHGKEWDSFLPRLPWNMKRYGGIADGVGFVTAFVHTEIPNAEVIVYEFEGKWLRDNEHPVQMITYHCTGCHQDTFHDSGHVHENSGPHSRRWAARQARQHIINANRYGVGGYHSPCRPNGGKMLRTVNAIARDRLGMNSNPLPDTDDGFCATQGPCSVIRNLRVGIKPPVYHA